MTPEIKQRIEQMRRGEVPEGYRYIRNSICPIDWTMKRVGDCIEEYREISNDIQSFPVYSSSRKGLVLQSEYYDQKKTEETNLGYKIVPNGYVTYRHMSDDDVFHFNINQTGGAILVSSEYPVFTSANGVAIGFLIPALNDTVRFRYFCRTQKLGGTRTRLYLKNLSQYRLSVPCFQEQQKIAAILTTQDKVIELKEKRLVEKQRQKKYLMQQLLTGRKRLPGFSGEWTFPKAKEIFQSVSDKDHNGDLAVLSSTQDRGIVPRNEVDIDIKYDACSLVNYKKVTKGNFVISLRSFQGGIEYSTYTGLVSPAYTVLASRQEISAEYYKQFFKSVDYINRLNVAVYGIRDGKQISYGDFGRLRIPYPPIKEQIAIAEVLTAADREMELLRQEIEQEKQKKKALMQLLLTGIVRVKI